MLLGAIEGLNEGTESPPLIDGRLEGTLLLIEALVGTFDGTLDAGIDEGRLEGTLREGSLVSD